MSRIIDANIKVHTAMAGSYNKNEPHFRPENREKVRRKLAALKQDGYRKLLDIGCGTGFIIDLSRDLFEEIHGVDVTQAMLDQVDRSSGNITLHRVPAEQLPFPDASFDMVTAYSFLHHLEDYRPVLREALRVLRPGGCMYVDLEPNRAFWAALDALEKASAGRADELSDIVRREIGAVLHNDEAVAQSFGIEPEVFNDAEYIKARRGGIDAEEFRAAAAEAGFDSCETTFEWFLGQGAVMHGQSFADAERIEKYLRRVLPLSAHLFKYLAFVLRR